MNELIDNQMNEEKVQNHLTNLSTIESKDQICSKSRLNNSNQLDKISKLNRLMNRKFIKKFKKNKSTNLLKDLSSNKLSTNLDEMFETENINLDNSIDCILDDENLMNLNKVNLLKNNQLKTNLDEFNCDDKIVKCENQILNNQSINDNLLDIQTDNYYFVDEDNDENCFNNYNEFNLINNLECNLSNSSEDRSSTSIDEIFNHNNQLNCTLNEQTNFNIDNYINNDLNNFNNSNIDTITYSINNEHLEKTTNYELKNNDVKIDNLELNKCSDLSEDNLQLNENILNVIISNNQFNSQTNLDRKKIGSLSLNSITNNLIIKQSNKHYLLNNNLDDNKIKLNNDLNQQNYLDNYIILYNNNQINSNKKKISNNEQIVQLKNSIDSSNCLNSLYSLANNLDLEENSNQLNTQINQSSKKTIINNLNQDKLNQTKLNQTKLNQNSSSCNSLNPFSLECRIPLPSTLANDHNIFIDNKNFIKRRNQRERIRVKEINERFEKLRKHLPTDYEQFIDPNSLSTNLNNSINSTDLKFRNSSTFYMPNLNGNEINNSNSSSSSSLNKERRLSKVETLRLAICYIKHLQNILNSS